MILNEGLDKFLESVKPQKISYGTNPETDNGLFFDVYGSVGTYFKYDGLYYIVLFDGAEGLPHVINELSSTKVYEIAFAVSDTFSVNRFEFVIKTKIHFTKNTIKAFSYIIYVINEIIQHVNDVDYLIFNGVDTDRKDLYSIMVTNKLLKREIENNIKFQYIGELYDYFTFKRIH